MGSMEREEITQARICGEGETREEDERGGERPVDG